MLIRSLGYVGLGCAKLEDWRMFATGLLGMQVVETGRSRIKFRMDDLKQRMFVDASPTASAYIFGWEVEDATALDRLAQKLDRAGVRHQSESAAMTADRCVADLISFEDPMGNRLEAFWGAGVDTQPFQPGRSISGFRTGPLGMGHAVLTAPNLNQGRVFYEEVLGFRLTDYITKPFTAYFFHLNDRHHSLALIQDARQGVHHLMAEYTMIDDVGQGYDVATQQDLVNVSLGRHANDFMLSFYANSPSGCLFECGWGGLSIDVDHWVASECEAGPSLWGHERSWLPEDRRQLARALCIDAAENGVRAPVNVLSGNYKLADA